MKKSAEITPDSFANAFRTVIRVGFNWDRFFEEGWPVEAVTLNSHADLMRCFMPWYIGKTGNEVNYDHPEAAPMNLGDVPATMQILNEERQGDIQDYVKKFNKERGVVEFTAPTYTLPENRHFVLDRNHRLSALMLAKAPFKVTLWNVCGPLDPDCLLDLIHFYKTPAAVQSKRSRKTQRKLRTTHDRPPLSHSSRN